MNASKSIAAIAAMLITAAGMAAIANYSNAAADSAHASVNASTTAVITTLPTIEVQPTAAQLRQVHGAATVQGAGKTSDASMPFYSFADDATGA